jgi:DNA-binding GntR family transcriptional regulator
MAEEGGPRQGRISEDPEELRLMAREPGENALRFAAYKAVKDRILYLDLKPGEKIVEQEIASELGVSRTPVREALLMLQSEKLVECNDRTGFIVRKFPMGEIAEYFAVRSVIETFVMSLVLERITEDDLEALRENIREAERYVDEGDLRNIIRTSSEFHEILYKATKSEVLLETISTLVDKFQWFRSIALSEPRGAKQSLSQHKKILAAIEKKDAKRLKVLMRAHFLGAQKRLAGAPRLLF